MSSFKTKIWIPVHCCNTCFALTNLLTCQYPRFRPWHKLKKKKKRNRLLLKRHHCNMQLLVVHYIMVNARLMIVFVKSACWFVAFSCSSAVWLPVASNHVSQTRRARLLSAHISDHMQTCLHTHTGACTHTSTIDTSDMKDVSSVWTNWYASLSMYVWRFAPRQTATLSGGEDKAELICFHFDFSDRLPWQLWCCCTRTDERLWISSF